MSKVMVVAAVLAGTSVLVALLWPSFKRRVIYPGGVLPTAMADPGLHGLEGAEEVWLEAEDGARIHAWWTPAAAGEARGAARGAVLYSHGNAESMATRAWIARRLARRGFDVLLYDYRGYGLSGGRPSEEGLARDARAAWRHLVKARGVPPRRIVLMGHSLGSAVATRLALEVEVGEVENDDAIAALVVGSPFPDMPTLFRHHAPWLPGFLLRWRTDRLDAGSRLGRVRAPVLVLVGSEDATIPPAISRGVHEAAGDGARLVEVAAEHGTLMGHPDVWRALDRFLERLDAR